jgi:Ca-activated chloride channel family protein
MRQLRKAGSQNLKSWQVLPLFVLAFASSQAGQQSNPATGGNDGLYKLSVDVNMVVLHATVRDAKGHLVSGLGKQDFQVFDGAAKQDIRLFRHEDIPVAVGLLVDNSGSMRRKRAQVVAAAEAFVRRSNPKDAMFVLNFNERAVFGLPDTELFSADTLELERALPAKSIGGRTALYDAIEVALRHIHKAGRDKKVLIVISDGGDNASRHTLDQVLQDAERSDAIIHTIGLFDEYDTDRNPKALRRLARVTGGESFFPKEIEDVVEICENIAEDIRHQYTIGYVPADRTPEGGFRAVKVIAAAQDHRKLSVRTRSGYMAPPSRGGVPTQEKATR